MKDNSTSASFGLIQGNANTIGPTVKTISSVRRQYCIGPILETGIFPTNEPTLPGGALLIRAFRQVDKSLLATAGDSIERLNGHPESSEGCQA